MSAKDFLHYLLYFLFHNSASRPTYYTCILQKFHFCSLLGVIRFPFLFPATVRRTMDQSNSVAAHLGIALVSFFWCTFILHSEIGRWWNLDCQCVCCYLNYCRCAKKKPNTNQNNFSVIKSWLVALQLESLTMGEWKGQAACDLDAI